MAELQSKVEETIQSLKKLEDKKQTKEAMKSDIKNVINSLKKSLKEYEESDIRNAATHFENGIKSLYWSVSDQISKAQKELLSKYEKTVNAKSEASKLITERSKQLKEKIGAANKAQKMDKSKLSALKIKINEAFDSIENNL